MSRLARHRRGLDNRITAAAVAVRAKPGGGWKRIGLRFVGFASWAAGQAGKEAPPFDGRGESL